MDSINWIMNRKSVRSFTDAPVSAEDLETILRAGMAAPAAVNQQMWEFLVIDQPEILKKLGEQLPYAKMLLQSPAAIIVCGNEDKAFDKGAKTPYWIMDCSAATENILLAVEVLGLGAVWTAVYPNPPLVASVRQILGLPENVIPLNVIPIGHPAKAEKPKDKWNPAVIHKNHW